MFFLKKEKKKKSISSLYTVTSLKLLVNFLFVQIPLETQIWVYNLSGHYILAERLKLFLAAQASIPYFFLIIWCLVICPLKKLPASFVLGNPVFVWEDHN